ncbi:MAG: EAL domain-containing protein [Lachnospiraceae bacterium]|nr:EAL domain-containing protein [Lachnospiraceae bacterium]
MEFSLYLTESVFGEIASFMLGALILFFMIYTTPRKSRGYQHLLWGMILSVMGSLLLTLLAIPWSEMPTLGSSWFQAISMCCFLYLLIYHQILICIFSYMNFVLSRDRLWSPVKKWGSVIFSLLYLLPAGGMLLRTVVRGSEVTNQAALVVGTVHYCAFFGFLFSIGCIVVAVHGWKTIPRVVRVSFIAFMPIVLVLLLFQYFVDTDLFLSVTYVLPFTIFYMMFHSNPYDEVMGTMNYDSMQTVLREMLENNDRYVAVEVRFPQLQKPTMVNDTMEIASLMTSGCQAAERLGRKVRLFREDRTTFMLISKVESRKEGKEIAKGVFELVDSFRFSGNTLFYYKILALYNDPVIKDFLSFQMFRQFLRSNMNDYTTSQFRVASQKDYDDFALNYKVRQALTDIRDRADAEDPRVLCYAQPIYNVERQGFFTAESLMRLNLDGEIIPPNVVIPLAEEIHCVHALSCIMLNKVCREIERMGDDYEYEAITMNISATELSAPSVCSDFYEILAQHHVPVGKVRMEITESAVFEDYDTVNDNIRQLIRSGINLYLDDFGTGYSNIERLATYRFHTIKFDKSLLYKAMESEKLDEMVSAMVSMLKNDDHEILVEGVETEEQSRYSIERGFNEIQGFKYAKPAPIEELVNYFGRKDAKSV